MNRRSRRIVAAICVSSVLAGAGVANAAPVLFTSRDAFDAVAQPNRDITFDATFRDCHFIDLSTCVYTFDELLTVVYDFAGIGLLGDTLGLGPWNGQSSGARFLQPVSAIGFDLVTIQSPQPAQFQYADSTYQFGAGGMGLPQFFGAVFDDPTTQIPALARVDHATPHGGTVGFAIQNLSVRTVPEPGTIWLILAGLGTFAGCRRLIGVRR